MFWCSLVGADRPPKFSLKNAGCQAGRFGFVCPLTLVPLSAAKHTHTYCPFHAVNKWHYMFKRKNKS